MRQEILATHPANASKRAIETPKVLAAPEPIPSTGKPSQNANTGVPVAQEPPPVHHAPLPATPANIWQFDLVHHRLVFTAAEKGRQDRKSLQCKEFSRVGSWQLATIYPTV